MVWWCRDSSLWSQSMLFRYARRALRDKDAALRTRCFSKSQQNPAQHKDEEDRERPIGLSDLEWVRLQHYRRWRRWLERDPYRALFGASNDMLLGKGLKDWQWVYKNFPKWMTKGMELPEHQPKEHDSSKPDASLTDRNMHNTPQSSTNSSAANDSSSEPLYPKKINISTEQEIKAQPYHSKRIYKETSGYSTGISSPSDPRRPPEHTAGRQTSQAEVNHPQGGDFRRSVSAQASRQEASSAETTSIKEYLNEPYQSPKTLSDTENKSCDWRWKASSRGIPPSSALNSEGTIAARNTITDRDVNIAPSEPTVNDETNTTTFSERSGTPMPACGQSSPEPPLPIPSYQSSEVFEENVIDRFQNDIELPNTSDKAIVIGYGDSKTRESDIVTNDPALEDKSPTPKVASNLQRQSPVESHERDIPDKPQSWSVPHASAPHYGSFEPLIEDNASASQRPHQKWHTSLNGKSVSNDIIPESSKGTSQRSMSILAQLPKDDVDFLSADEIRASMGHRTVNNRSDEKEIRRVLEIDYENTVINSSIDSFIGSTIINDQQARRRGRELKTEGLKKVRKAEEQGKVSPTKVMRETSLDHTRKRLQASSDAFASNSWTDPTKERELLAMTRVPEIASDPLMRGIISGVYESRRAMQQIREDLTKELPIIERLLYNLTSSEAELISAVGALARLAQASSPPKSDFSSKDAREKRQQYVNDLRRRLDSTDKLAEEANSALDDMITKFDGKPVSEVFKSRLSVSSEVLNKNLKLTRRIMFGFQVRLESLKIDTSDPKVRNVGNCLLALQDTQLALTLLVGRALQAYGITPKLEGERKAKPRDIVDPTAASNSSASEQIEAGSGPATHATSTTSLITQNISEDEIQAQQSAIPGHSNDGYSRSLNRAHKDLFNDGLPPEHQPFRPLQLDGLDKNAEVVTTGKAPTVHMNHGAMKNQQLQQDSELVQEIKKAYEDVYGPITVHHVQEGEVDQGAVVSSSKMPELRQDMQKVKLDDVFANKPAAIHSATPETASKKETVSAMESSSLPLKPRHDGMKSTAANLTAGPQATAKPSSDRDASRIPGNQDVLASSNQTIPARDEHSEGQQAVSAPTDASTRAEKPLPKVIKYKVLAYDPDADELSVMTTQSYAPSSTSVPIFLPEALSSLETPVKFIPHLPQGFDIIACSRNLLVLQESSSASTNIEDVNKIKIWEDELKERDPERKHTNPVDGTQRYSPTGYVGVEDLGSGLEKTMWQEQQRAKQSHDQASGETRRDERGGGAVSSVLKTSIFVAGACYVAGVVGELWK